MSDEELHRHRDSRASSSGALAWRAPRSGNPHLKLELRLLHPRSGTTSRRAVGDARPASDVVVQSNAPRFPQPSVDVTAAPYQAHRVRILFTSLRNTSHFLPLVPFIQACARSGHEVAVAAPSELAERAAAAGAAFFPLSHPGDEGLRPLWMRTRGASEDEAMRVVVHDVFADACAGAALPDMLRVMTQWRPAIVVRESQEYAAVIAGEKLDVPHARVAISTPSGEASRLGIAVPAVDAHRARLGLGPASAEARLAHEPILTLFPQSFDAGTALLPPVLRFRAARGAAQPLPEYWPGRQGPFVYVTFGTVTGGAEMWRYAYRLALDAIAPLPIRVLLTIGAELPIDALGALPPNVHVERFVPQDRVLPHAAAVVCHGGSGTLIGALSCGVPLVVLPLFADQPFNAARVAAIGAGLSLPGRGVPAEDLRQALARVLEDGRFRDEAQRIAREVAQLPSVEEAAPALERLAAADAARDRSVMS